MVSFDPDALPDDAPADEAAHLDDFRAPDLDLDEKPHDDVVTVDADGEPVATIIEVDQISKEAFWVVFKHAFGMPGMFVAVWKPLAVQPDEGDAARSASDAIYELLEIYFPGALLPQGDTLARLLACVPFLLAKIMVVRTILAQSRAPKQPQPGQFKSRREKPDEFEADQPSPSDWMDQERRAA